MEVCGTHTMAAARSGLRTVLPSQLRLISGPGCPVCVTEVGYVDHALALARRNEVIIATFGDLVRVPGSAPLERREAPPTLSLARAEGCDVRVVYSPRDALALATAEPRREVVFLGVGFETTAPALAAAVAAAAAARIDNFSMLLAAKTIPEALAQLAAAPDVALDGLLCPGHVSVILGPEAYEPVVSRFGLPCAIAGFEPLEMLRGLKELVEQVVSGQPRVANCYPGAVRPGGNPKARALVDRVFEPCDARWRGLGTIPGSGLEFRPDYRRLDASRRFDVELPEPVEPRGCRCGDVLRGLLDPIDCGLFGTHCTPEAPRGACMVSSEGSCAARYHYRLEQP
ncbi:MAG: hydrogenase formation protein HypD [Deltaproteobacteria bacterium]|nr:hydrogenase formation protein HypD [Deltaproteobacteria bacterium]MBW2534580.1 hydrogenase formation protein HypD [Deltaproteobacteria bacterium]